MAVFLQLVPKGDEGLNISATADSLNNDIEFDVPVPGLSVDRKVGYCVSWRTWNKYR